jgi:hypothetical protein
MERDPAEARRRGTVNAAGAVGAIGWITQAAAGSTTCSVRLCPSVGSPAVTAAETTHEAHPKHEHERELAGAKRH